MRPTRVYSISSYSTVIKTKVIWSINTLRDKAVKHTDSGNPLKMSSTFTSGLPAIMNILPSTWTSIPFFYVSGGIKHTTYLYISAPEMEKGPSANQVVPVMSGVITGSDYTSAIDEWGDIFRTVESVQLSYYTLMPCVWLRVISLLWRALSLRRHVLAAVIVVEHCQSWVTADEAVTQLWGAKDTIAAECRALVPLERWAMLSLCTQQAKGKSWVVQERNSIIWRGTLYIYCDVLVDHQVNHHYGYF